jgi:hypothetical protein
MVIDLLEEKIKEVQELAKQKRFQEMFDRMKLEDVEEYDEVIFKVNALQLQAIKSSLFLPFL